MLCLLSRLGSGAFAMTALLWATASVANAQTSEDRFRLLSCGTHVSGELAFPGQSTAEYFHASAGEVVDLTLVETSGFGASTPRATVIGPLGVPLDGGFNANALHTLTITETGFHTIEVRAFDALDVGTYNLGFECVTPLGPVVVALTCGDLFEGDLVVPGQVDFITFDGAVDDVVDLTLIALGSTGYVPFPPPPTPPTKHVRATVFAPSGAAVRTFDSNNLTSLTLTETGTYAIRVWATAMGETGPYNLGLECRSPASQVITQLQCGDLWSEQLTEPGEVDLYTFMGTPGDIVEPTLVETAGFVDSVPKMHVFAPSGALLGSFNANTLDPIVVSEAGLHTIRVAADTLYSIGTYNLGLPCRPPVGSATSLACGASQPGFLVAAGSVDYYTFDATAGDVNELTLTIVSGLETSARMRLFSPSGVDLGSFQADVPHAMAIAETGTYVVRVTATDLAKDGQYVLDRACLPSGPAPVHLGCGSLASGAITAAGQTDNFTFYASAGETIELMVVESGWPTGANARASLVSPTGVAILTFDSNSLKGFALTETGIYSLTIKASNLVSKGNYKVGLECRCPLGPVEAHLVPGDLVRDRVNTWGESDWFTFSGTAGEVVELMVVESGWPTGANARATVFSPSCSAIVTYDSNSLNAITLSETGTYSIRVRANNLLSSGNYKLGLERRCSLGPVEAHLVPGDLVRSGVSTWGESDWYTFDGVAGEELELMVVESGWPTGANARVTVFLPSCTAINTYDSNSLNPITLPETGEYSIRVRANNLLSTGDYKLGLETRCPIGPVEAQLEPGSLVSDRVSTWGESDWFTFEGSSGEVVELMVVESGWPTGANARATVIAPSCTGVGTYDSNTLNAITLPETGTYSIRVRANNLLSTGNYKLGLERRCPLGPVEANLVLGDLHQDSISTWGESDWFTFSGTAGDVLELMVVESGWPTGANARVTVFTPSCAFVGEYDSNTLNVITLAETGTYSIRVRANNLLSSGNYRLGLEGRCPLGPVEANLVLGDLHQDSISTWGESDWFTFSGNAGDMVELMAVESGWPTGASARVTVIAPSCTGVGTYDSNTLNVITLPETGTYSIRVRANNLLSAGAYKLGLEGRCPLGPVDGALTCTTPYSDAISTWGESDWITFDGVAGMQLDLTATESGWPTGASARVSVFSSSCVHLGTFDSNGTMSFPLPETGTYAIRVRANNLLSSGSYTLTASCL